MIGNEVAQASCPSHQRPAAARQQRSVKAARTLALERSTCLRPKPDLFTRPGGCFEPFFMPCTCSHFAGMQSLRLKNRSIPRLTALS